MPDAPPPSASGGEPATWLVEPVTGVFASSWRSALQMGVIVGALIFGGIAFIGWLDEDPRLLPFGAVFSVGYVLLEALLYRSRGSASVEITPEAAVVTRLGGRPVRIAWAGVKEARYRSAQMGDSWVLRDTDARVVLSERGFTTDDWLAIRRGINDWKSSGPLATLPGVDAERQRPGPHAEGAVFRAHQPAALFWGIPFFAACAAIGLASSWNAYGDGSWPEDLMLSVGLPVIGFGFVAMGLFGLSRAVKRVMFGPRAMRVERYIGATRTVRYAEIVDGWGNRIQTRHGTFSLGDRNADTFWRLLEEHLTSEQLSGEMMAQEVSQLSAIGLQLGFLFGLPILAGLAGWGLGLSEGYALALSLALFLVFAAASAVRTRRRARRWIEEGKTPEDSNQGSGE